MAEGDAADDGKQIPKARKRPPTASPEAAGRQKRLRKGDVANA